MASWTTRWISSWLSMSNCSRLLRSVIAIPPCALFPRFDESQHAMFEQPLGDRRLRPIRDLPGVHKSAECHAPVQRLQQLSHLTTAEKGDGPLQIRMVQGGLNCNEVADDAWLGHQHRIRRQCNGEVIWNAEAF